MAPPGVGMARWPDGRPVFVQGAFPGDVVIPQDYAEKRSHLIVRKFALQEKSSARRDSPCPVSETCGGCDFIGISERHQQEQKQAIVLHALERTAKLRPPQPVLFHASPRSLGYRRRARLHMRDGRLGYCRKSSHELVEFAHCLVCSPRLNRVIDRLRGVLAQHSSAFRCVGAVEARAFGDDGALCAEDCSLFLQLRPQASKAQISRLEAALLPLENEMACWWGKGIAPLQQFSLGRGTGLFAPVGGFVQVNARVNEQLVAHVVALAERISAKNFVDVFCGNGNFSIPLLEAGLSGCGVELNPDSLRALKQAQKRGGFSRLEGAWLEERAETFLGSEQVSAKSWDLVVLDPPRSGCKEAMSALLALSPGHVILVGCDAVTLARDLRLLIDGPAKGAEPSSGASPPTYRLLDVQIFDMFPQTHHVETVALLQRST